MAAHGKDAAMADARPLNLLTVSACLMKSTLLDVAYSLVLIESIGNKTKSIEVPAMPPAKMAVNEVRKVKDGATTYGLLSAIRFLCFELFNSNERLKLN